MRRLLATAFASVTMLAAAQAQDQEKPANNKRPAKTEVITILDKQSSKGLADPFVYGANGKPHVLVDTTRYSALKKGEVRNMRASESIIEKSEMYESLVKESEYYPVYILVYDPREDQKYKGHMISAFEDYYGNVAAVLYLVDVNDHPDLALEVVNGQFVQRRTPFKDFYIGPPSQTEERFDHKNVKKNDPKKEFYYFFDAAELYRNPKQHKISNPNPTPMLQRG
ncbi:MAG: hypothetical protein KDJ35_06280 [Alphaproteobacteria bacterium]|nr:hypothetical protein [Alphaproteobacteria bacterium]